MARIINRAEAWEKIHTSFSQINFNTFDYDSVKESLLNYIKIYYPEDFADFIESSEFISLLELFSYTAELLAYRLDMNAHENFITTAERKESILRLAKLISYKSSRNIPARGLVKIQSIQTSENVVDLKGKNLTNKIIVWNDPNNPDWKEQFLLVMDRVLEQKFGTVRPKERKQVDDILFELYSLNNSSLNNSGKNVFPYSAGEPMELVPVNLTEFGPEEKRPERNSKFTLMYAYDGIGDASNTTGFLMYTKQGTLIRNDAKFDGKTPNQTLDIDVKNINETDVWVNNVDADTGEILINNPYEDILKHHSENSLRYGEWIEVKTISGENIVFNTIEDKNKYEIETLDNDKIRIIFGENEFSNIPSGTFDIWYRVSSNTGDNIQKSSIQNKQSSFNYVDSLGNNQSFKFTFSAINSLLNASSSEDIEKIRQNAPSVYYTQDRMVNGRDYNSYMLQDPSILKLRALNRTFSGESKYMGWHDPREYYENVKMFGDDCAFYWVEKEPEKGGLINVNSGINPEDLIYNYIEPLLSSSDIYMVLAKEMERLNIEPSRLRIEFSKKPYSFNASTNEVESLINALNRSIATTSVVNLWYSVFYDEWTIDKHPCDGNDTCESGDANSIRCFRIDATFSGSVHSGWEIKRRTKRLLVHSENTKFWNTNDVNSLIDYDSFNEMRDEFVILAANIHSDHDGILKRNYTYHVAGQELLEQNLPNAGLPDIHRLSILPIDENEDGIPDNLSQEDVMDTDINLDFEWFINQGLTRQYGDINALPEKEIVLVNPDPDPEPNLVPEPDIVQAPVIETDKKFSINHETLNLKSKDGLETYREILAIHSNIPGNPSINVNSITIDGGPANSEYELTISVKSKIPGAYSTSNPHVYLNASSLSIGNILIRKGMTKNDVAIEIKKLLSQSKFKSYFEFSHIDDTSPNIIYLVMGVFEASNAKSRRQLLHIEANLIGDDSDASDQIETDYVEVIEEAEAPTYTKKPDPRKSNNPPLYTVESATAYLIQKGVIELVKQSFNYLDSRTGRSAPWDGKSDWDSYLNKYPSARTKYRTYKLSCGNFVAYNGGRWSGTKGGLDTRGNRVSWPGASGAMWDYRDKDKPNTQWGVISVFDWPQAANWIQIPDGESYAGWFHSPARGGSRGTVTSGGGTVTSGGGTSTPKPAPKPEPKPEPKPAPKPEPIPAPVPAPIPAPVPAPLPANRQYVEKGTFCCETDPPMFTYDESYAYLNFVGEMLTAQKSFRYLNPGTNTCEKWDTKGNFKTNFLNRFGIDCFNHWKNFVITAANFVAHNYGKWPGTSKMDVQGNTITFPGNNSIMWDYRDQGLSSNTRRRLRVHEWPQNSDWIQIPKGNNYERWFHAPEDNEETVELITETPITETPVTQPSVESSIYNVLTLPYNRSYIVGFEDNDMEIYMDGVRKTFAKDELLHSPNENSNDIVRYQIMFSDKNIPSPNTIIRIFMKDWVYFTRENVSDRWKPQLPSTDVKIKWALEKTKIDSEKRVKRHEGRYPLNFGWFHFVPTFHLVDPAATNIIDTFIITEGYYTAMKQWLDNRIRTEPAPPTPLSLRNSFAYLLKSKMISDTVVLQPGIFKVLFGQKASKELRSRFKVIRPQISSLSDSEIKTRIVNSTKEFFNLKYWEFGEGFFFSELSSAIHADIGPEIDSIVLVPTFTQNEFGDMYQIQARENEIFIPDISANDIDIVSSYTPENIRQISE